MMWGIGYNMLGWGWLTGILAIAALLVSAVIGIRLLSGRARSSTRGKPRH